MGPENWSKRCQHYIMIMDDSVGGMRPDADLKVCTLDKDHEGPHQRETEAADGHGKLVMEWMIKEEAE